MTFADLLRTEREKRNYSQSGIAREVGITDRAVGLYENGKRLPSPVLARRIGQAVAGGDGLAFEAAVAWEKGEFEFDPAEVKPDAVLRALTELRAGGRR